MLAAVWTGPNLVARPFPGFRLHRKCYQTVYIFGLLFTALVTRCLRFWRFRKRREPLFHPCPDLAIISLSLSLVRIFSLFHFYFLSRPRYHTTSNFLRWWRVKEGKGLSPFRHGIGIVARMHSHDDDGGNVEERDSNERLLRSSFALTPIALDFHLEEAGCAEGSYEEITSGCTVTKRLFVFFFFGISSLVLPMNLEWEFFFKSFFLLLLFCCFAFPWFSLLSFFFVFFWPGMELKLFAWKIFLN